MLRAKPSSCCLLLVLLALAGGCKTGPAGTRPFWKFWVPREPAIDSPFSVEIPAPPEFVMPQAALRVSPPPAPRSARGEETDVKRIPAEVVVPALRTGYFDYDSARLTEEAKDILRQNAEWLRAHPEMEVQIQGHCDERGTVEYNFNLGQRRAEAVKDFLVGLGISSDRIQTISYGEERPVALEHEEDSWRLNRRAEFHAY